MIWLYRICFLPALLVLLPRYLLRMFRRGGYRDGFAERFGRYPDLPRVEGKRRVWVHAVSVGELRSIEPLIRRLNQRDDLEIIVTTTTSTGRELLRQGLESEVRFAGYFTLDAWPWVRRAWQRLQPDLLVVVDGELWPEHLRAARRFGVPVYLVNARISDRSFRRLQRLPQIARWLYPQPTRVLAASELDRERLAVLGVPSPRLESCGNLKVDAAIAAAAEIEGAHRETLGLPAEGRILLGASTWPGEERCLAEVWRSLRADFPDLRLVLVPRHVERRAEIERELQEAGHRAVLRSRGETWESADTLYVADTTGELDALTQVANFVWVGKSLPPHSQGQSPVAGALAAKPLWFGPRLTNFRAMAEGLSRAGGAISVTDDVSLRQSLASRLADSALARRQGAAARDWIWAQRGAGERVEAAILAGLPQPGADPAGNGPELS